MAYCGPAGIPYATFLEWDDLSRDAALAWQARENARCGGCGQVRGEWMTTGPDGTEVEMVPRPMAVDDVFCPPCESLELARKAREDKPSAGMHLAFVARPASAADTPDDGTIA